MPLILHIESATDICSVCLSKGDRLLVIKESEEPYSHASVITQLIASCFAQAGLSLNQIDAVALSKGPGSYTALRVGASAAKGICYALDKPMIAVDTLESLAWAAQRQESLEAWYAPMIDARRMEVYTMLFDNKMNTVESLEARIIDEAAYAAYFEQGHRIVFCGNGAPKCVNALSSGKAVLSNVVCSSAHLIPHALEAFDKRLFSDIAYFSPTYFKAPNITTPRKTL